MPRDLPLGNGSLLVNLDGTGQVRDIFWPHVGQENHSSGRVCRIGVWLDGRFSWLGDDGWQRRLRYGGDSLVGESIIENPDLGLRLLFRDGVDFHENLLVRQVSVSLLSGEEKEVRIFFCHDLTISGTTVGDSAYYEPEHRALFHYKGRRWFMFALFRGWQGAYRSGLDQWAVGVSGVNGMDGTWRDAEDGTLSGNPAAQGRIDSVIALHLTVKEGIGATGWLTMAVGRDFREVTRIHHALLRKGPVTYLERSAAYWRLWVNKEEESLAHLDHRLVNLYRRSLLILRTQIDNQGAIIAANDHDIAQFNRDTYSYMWPRDGALVCEALVRAGFSELSRNFIDFCHRAITDQGFLLHKYTPDGSLASSWHAWYGEDGPRLPIQEDETALVLRCLWRHFRRFRDIEFIKRHYRGLVIRSAEWMCTYIDKETGLPLPCWDLWEERYGVHAWTVAAVWSGLLAAAGFATAFGENGLGQRYQRVAARLGQAAAKHLYSERLGRFVRSLVVTRNGPRRDETMDASLCGLWLFGLFAPDDPRIVQTMAVMEKKLWVRTEVGGLARYEEDGYQRAEVSSRVPGNPWFICTLWLGRYRIAAATSRGELAGALELLEWAANHSLDSGVMAEQVHPLTDAPLSVSPLTWSHATYVDTLHHYLDRLREVSGHDQ